MTPTQITETWQTLPRPHLQSICHQGPRPIFATISGAHLYGFASPDSDIDLRGAFLHPVDAMLGLHPPDETWTLVEKEPFDLDWVAHDLRKFARLMTNHNGYVLEQLYSPLVVVTTRAHETLRELGRGCITRPTVRHYQGFARGRRKRLAEPDPTVKHLLYACRVLLSGIWLMRTGEVESNLPTLNEEFRIPEIDALIARKQGGTETMKLSEADRTAHDALLDRLEAELQSAHDTSHLPLEPTTTADLEAFAIQTRLDPEPALAEP